MRHLSLVLALLLAAPSLAAAGPLLDRLDRLSEAGRHDDVAEQARRWLDRNADDAERAEVERRLQEAEYQRLLGSPDVDAVRRYIAEFPEGPRANDARSLEANLELYAAAAKDTEDAFRAVFERYPSTAAGREARVGAERLGYAGAQQIDDLDAWSRFLSEYPDGAHAPAALDRRRELAWDRAEAENTVGAWLSLRAEDPEHPRADEAWAREQALAIAAVPPDAGPEPWVKLARRYEGSPGGWTALQRAIDTAPLLLEPGVAAPIADAPRSADGLRAASLQLGGRLPRDVDLRLAVEVRRAEAWLPWSDAARADGATDGEPPPDPEAARQFTTLLPLCRLPGVDRARLRVTAQVGERQREWVQDLELRGACGGDVPWAVQRIDGRVVAWKQGAATGERPDILGVEWSCDGPLVADRQGAWLTCNGWQFTPAGEGWFVRLPARGAEPTAELPWPAGPAKGWSRAAVPAAWHFGGLPGCPLDGLEPGAPPEPPAWLPATLSREVDAIADLDGDEVPDRLLLLRGGVDWAVVLPAGAEPHTAWVGRAPTGGVEDLMRSGCGFGDPASAAASEPAASP